MWFFHARTDHLSIWKFDFSGSTRFYRPDLQFFIFGCYLQLLLTANFHSKACKLHWPSLLFAVRYDLHGERWSSFRVLTIAQKLNVITLFQFFVDDKASSFDLIHSIFRSFRIIFQYRMVLHLDITYFTLIPSETTSYLTDMSVFFPFRRNFDAITNRYQLMVVNNSGCKFVCFLSGFTVCSQWDIRPEAVCYRHYRRRSARTIRW
jgi:hypothetical protein